MRPIQGQLVKLKNRYMEEIKRLVEGEPKLESSADQASGGVTDNE